MEPRNYEADAIATPPDAPTSPSNGYPTDGDPQSGAPATWPGAYWIYKVGESLRKIITDAGLTPDDSDMTQLKTALVSPQTDVNAGTDDNRFVTPKKLRWGFSILLATPGYIAFPTWLGGLIIQFGVTSTVTAGEVKTITLPTTFPNSPLHVLATARSGNSSTARLAVSAEIVSTSQIKVVNTTSDSSVAIWWNALGK